MMPPGGGVGMGLRQSDTELREKFTPPSPSMKADGTLNALLKQWFGDEVPLFE
jgi:polar amino acid transport system substrate-binding protein